MRLKRVRIFGFKTFAEKTEFEMKGNVIAIIGPNGCGKSNIVDAILWVLGESNARSLRAQNHQEIIFNGSKDRKPLGFAEVQVTFDNEDRSLYSEFSEIVISRRITRSGESHYSINRHTCRQKDILDLLADTGLGRTGYSIVSQKEIDVALAASAEDRRVWVDEAAGIQKYKTRRQESIKRLKATLDHLEQVDHVLFELEAQYKPLAEEAEKAKKYKQVRFSLQKVECDLLCVQMAKAVEELDAFARDVEVVFSALEKAKDHAKKVERSAHEILEITQEKELQVEKAREELQKCLMEGQSLESRLQSSLQKLESLRQLESSMVHEAEHHGARREELLGDVAQIEEQVLILQKELCGLNQKVSTSKVKHKEKQTNLQALEAKLLKAKREQAEQIKLEVALRQKEEQKLQFQSEVLNLERELPALEKEVEEIQDQLNNFLNKEQKLAMQVEANQKELTAHKEKEQTLRLSMQKKLSERAQLEGQRRGIQSTIEAHEGFSFGTKAVLTAVKKGLLPQGYISVGEAIDVPKEFALSIETALGGSVNDLIVPEESLAKTAIEYLKKNQLGRATFQPIPLIRPYAQRSEILNLLSSPGILGIASDCIQCKKEYFLVIQSLLGRILIIENLDVSLKYAKTSGWNRLVTLSGEIIHSSGAVTGGASNKTSSGLLQRKADLKSISKEVEVLGAKVANLEESLKENREAQQLCMEIEKALKADLWSLEQQSKEFHRTFIEGKQKQQSIFDRMQNLKAKLERLSDHVPELPKLIDLTSLEADRDVLFAELTGERIESEQIARAFQEKERDLQALQAQKEKVLQRLNLVQESETERAKRIEALKQEQLQLEVQEKELRIQQSEHKKKSALEEEVLAGLMHAREEVQKENRLLFEVLKESQRQVQDYENKLHHFEMKRARAESGRASVLQKLLEEYGMDQKEALERAPKAELSENAQELVGVLRRQLRGMGEVNLGAIEAYERLNSRHFELKAQKEDVLRSKAEIEAGMKELDFLTRDRFLETFDALQKSFAKNFTILFGDGHGHLFLTEPENLLETGIEVEVTLPGKRKQRLQLLSGGERALCACALLFGLLEVRPSPLVVLDEVDAPLDGRNVERYIQLLHEFALSTQFLLITHNPATIESATTWFGITMQEPGVSSLIPYEFSRKELTPH